MKLKIENILFLVGAIVIIVAILGMVGTFDRKPVVNEVWIERPPVNPFEDTNRCSYTVMAVSNGYVLYRIHHPEAGDYSVPRSMSLRAFVYGRYFLSNNVENCERVLP